LPRTEPRRGLCDNRTLGFPRPDQIDIGGAVLAKVFSCAVVGLDGVLVEVEVDVGQGVPGTVVVGLPDAAVRESQDRVRAAIRNSGGRFPVGRVTVNLAPADLKKAGPTYDLPIALGILLASNQVVPSPQLEDALVAGELSLDGVVRHTPGIIAMISTAAANGMRRAFVPAIDAGEAALVGDVEIIPVQTLADLVNHLSGESPIAPHTADSTPPASLYTGVDFSEVKGQEHVKRGLEIAASGAHNALLSGPPGSGKTMLARALPSILPTMTVAESLEVTKIYSVRGLLPAETPLLRERPFRSPHHTTSYVGLVGGGSWPRPGEISLAHRGVLFLDEMPEFGATKLEGLRQPLEDRTVTLARAAGTLSFPANFTLIAAMNPCPCGYYGDPRRACSCAPGAIGRYQKRISGPLLDRIDIHLDVPRIPHEQLSDRRPGELSAAIQDRVERARAIQATRFAGTALLTNADMGPKELRLHAALDETAETLLGSAVRQMSLSARGYHRVLKLARTIADLAAEEPIATAHVAEALQYRPRVAEG
jgi:magnesium chelatase family protein